MVPALGPIKLCARAGNYSPFAVDFVVQDRMPIELASVCRVNGTFSIGLSFSGWNNNFFLCVGKRLRQYGSNGTVFVEANP